METNSSFLKGHLDHDQIEPYYQMADIWFCGDIALHDGMNLEAAKEFVATRSDENGVLIH